jgi:hypothetical protein
MKRSTLQLLIITAAIVAASTVASAQSLVSEIPFAFQASGAAMAPGKYRIKWNQHDSYVLIQNLQTAKAVFSRIEGPHDVPAAWQAGKRPLLEFACGDHGCRLHEFWPAEGPVRTFPSSKRDVESGSPRLTMIRIVATRQ